MAKKTTKKTTSRGKRMQVFDVRGVPEACLKRIKNYIEIECEMENGRLLESASVPSPPCGGPGDPC